MSTSFRETISTDNAPGAIGPYSQAIKCSGNFVFVSGQIPFVANSMTLVSEDISEQTEQVLKNLKAILDKSGASLQQVVKCQIFLKDLSDFEAVNKVYGEFFNENPPARACVEVSRLPKDVKVEIDAIAII